MTRLGLLLAAWLGAVPDSLPLDVRQAVEAAVRARVGGDAEIDVAAATVVGSPDGATAPWADARIVDAVLSRGATTRGPLRVWVRADVDRGAGRVLSPVAALDLDLRVSVTHWHTTRTIARGAVLETPDLVRARHVLAPGALLRPPAEDALVGARALRDLPADACLLASVVVATPALRAGDEVTAWLRVPGVEVRTRMVAVDTGRLGATVRVRSVEGKKSIRARVIGRAEVEIVDGH